MYNIKFYQRDIIFNVLNKSTIQYVWEVLHVMGEKSEFDKEYLNRRRKVVVFNRVLELTDSSLTLDSISDF